ncbi:MAG TPA: hypothetical protein VH916_01270 [Dehalococcoidia bacterium]
MIEEVVQLAGALLVLAGFALAQFGTLEQTSSCRRPGRSSLQFGVVQRLRGGELEDSDHQDVAVR